MMRRLRRWTAMLAAVVLALAAALIGWALAGGQADDLPWRPLDLSHPIGVTTGRRLAALAGDPAQCRALLAAAGVRVVALPPVRAGACGYDDAVRFTPGALAPPLRPAGVGLACPVAAGLSLWTWDVLQPAAARLGTRVVAVEHVGAYNCRRIAGRVAWSEHARADAIDVTGFRLADGRHVTIARDWHGSGEAALFLHAARDGACRVFATVLSPDYNAAHRDHLHLDQAPRGAWGWRACR